jgi:uncharacterized BrkB/YihY/UPF0761 family membrane protein
MSAGGLFGMVMNMVFAAGLWTVIGAVVDRMGAAFNTSIRMLPTFQDALNGFTIIQTVYGVLLIIIFITLIVNYIMNENSLASGEV